MDENKIFKYIGRVNAVAILFILLFVVGFGGYNFIIRMISNDNPVVLTNIADDPAGEEKWSLGSPEKIDGTDYIYIPLVSEKKDISTAKVQVFSKQALHSYSGGYFSPSRNLLFVNAQTREMNWLFQNNGQLIVDIDLLSVQQKYATDKSINAILYRIIKKDTNADGQLTTADLTNIAISLPDGGHYTEILQTVDRILGARSIDKMKVLILYQSAGKGYALAVSLKDMSVMETKEMPKVEKP